jgi:hypothetical protein
MLFHFSVIDCPPNTYGVGCQPCSCRSFQLCHIITGECQCPAGWKGDACQFPLTANGPGLYSIVKTNRIE